jgi:hypothetical protein
MGKNIDVLTQRVKITGTVNNLIFWAPFFGIKNSIFGA